MSAGNENENENAKPECATPCWPQKGEKRKKKKRMVYMTRWVCMQSFVSKIEVEDAQILRHPAKDEQKEMYKYRQ